jgi:hypothetical protein
MTFALIVKLLLAFVLICIVFQDLKERKVTFLLFILLALTVAYLHYIKVEPSVFMITIIFNIALVMVLFFIMRVYSNLKLKKDLDETFGLGDGLFFIAFATAFPTYIFLVLFSFSLIFSGLLFYMFRKKLTDNTVPLAGLQALFLLGVFSLNWIFNFTDLYFI